jgi:pyruvate dehydrogenase (quinone)
MEIVMQTPQLGPGGQVVSLSGGSGFTMQMCDLISLKQLGVPVKVVVFNNGALGFIEFNQKSTVIPDFGTEFKNPTFAAMAEAIGICGMRLEDPAKVKEEIAAAAPHRGPALVDAVINLTELAIPPAIGSNNQGLLALHCESSLEWPLR